MKNTRFTPEEKAHPSVWTMRYGWLMSDITRAFWMNEIGTEQMYKYRELLSKARTNKFIG